MIIETERLSIIPLKIDELELFLNDMEKFEERFQVKYEGEVIEGFLRKIQECQLLKMKSDSGNYIWHTFWLINRKLDNIIVGSISFKDIPNINNEVEIGYGLGENHRHNGYMTETVKGICDWALSKESINTIIAETEKENIASQNLLIKNGFIKYLIEETIWWKLEQ